MPIKYRAFLSYSHCDHREAKRLHRQLEGYHVDETLVGRATPIGTVPNRLRPIFRDREGLSVGPSLHRQIEKALENSDALIVLCSPDSAKSFYVNEEITYFKKLGRSDRIFTYIVAGTPHDPDRECFPNALKYKVATGGQQEQEPAEPIAADAQPHGDGSQLALSKLISGLLGLPLGLIFRREQESERWRRKKLIGWSAVMTALALGTGIFGYHAHLARAQGEKLILNTLGRTASLIQQTAKLSNEYGVPLRASMELLREAEEALGQVEKLSGERSDLQIKRAELSFQFSDAYGSLNKREKQLSAALSGQDILKKLRARGRYDQRWLFAKVINPSGQIWSRLFDNDHRLVQLEKRAHLYVGRAYYSNGRNDKAADYYMSGLGIEEYTGEKMPLRAENHMDQAHLELGLAQILYEQKNYAAAQTRIANAIKRMSALKRDTRSFDGQLILAEAYIDLANLRRSITDNVHNRKAQPFQYDDAVADIEEGLQLVVALQAQQPMNIGPLRLLGRAYRIQGDIRSRQYHADAAIAAYGETQKIYEIMLGRDPNNARVRNSLAYSHMKLGEMLRKSKHRTDWENSINRYQKAIDLFTDLRKRRNIWLALWGIEQPLRALGRMDDLERAMRKKLEYANEGFVQVPPAPSAHLDVTRSHFDLGEFYAAQHSSLNPSIARKALIHFDAVLAMTAGLSDQAADQNALRRFRLGAYMGRSIVRVRANQFRLALESLNSARELARSMKISGRSEPDLDKQLAVVEWRTSVVRERMGSSADAMAACQKARSYIKQATTSSRVKAEWSSELEGIESHCIAIEKKHAF